MDCYRCPACEHPVAAAAWAEATSLTEAVLGRNVQSDWIEMRRCPSCELLLRRAASEQWQPAPQRLIAALRGGPQGRGNGKPENGMAGPHALAERATAEVLIASREIRDEAREKCAEARRIQERSADIRRALASRPERHRRPLASRA